MVANVLITGATGFTAPYVRAALESRGYRVIGIADTKIRGSDTEVVDLLDPAALRTFLERSPADYVIHLAGVSFVQHERAADQYEVNLIGSLNLLQVIASTCPTVKKIVLASSANIYGRPARIPVAEDDAAAPLSDYGVSKYAMELMARTWFERLPILIVRPFNYTGQGQSPRFILPKIAKHLSERAPEIEVGDTSVVREFMDVRDVAEIYAGVLESGRRSEAVNICSGSGHRLAAVIEAMKEISGHDIKLRGSSSLRRDNEIPELVGSPDKLRGILSGLSFRPLEETLRWLLAAPAR